MDLTSSQEISFPRLLEGERVQDNETNVFAIVIFIE